MRSSDKRRLKLVFPYFFVPHILFTLVPVPHLIFSALSLPFLLSCCHPCGLLLLFVQYMLAVSLRAPLSVHALLPISPNSLSCYLPGLSYIDASCSLLYLRFLRATRWRRFALDCTRNLCPIYSIFCQLSPSAYTYDLFIVLSNFRFYPGVYPEFYFFLSGEYELIPCRVRSDPKARIRGSDSFHAGP